MENSGEYKSETGCVCPLSGSVSCQRHGIRKNAHFHHLCQTRQDYFNMYERCVGPGQEFTNCDGTSPVPPSILVEGPKEPCPSCQQSKDFKPVEAKPEALNQAQPKLPSLWQQAKNFTKATVAHVASGMDEVTPDEQNARLAICKACPHFLADQNKCGHCGCPLKRKTSWKTSACPIGSWGPGKEVK